MKNLTLLIILCGIMEGISSQVLFDLSGNYSDGNSNGPEREFTEIEEYIIEDVSSYAFDDSVEWDAIHVVVVGDPDGYVELGYNQAMKDGRLPPGFQLSEIITTTSYIEANLSAYFEESINSGITFEPDVDGINTTRFVRGVFNALQFNVHLETNFEKRLVCIVAQAANISWDLTIGCINITYVGSNSDNRVNITYDHNQPDRIFMEGSTPIRVLNDDLIVEHNDHPKFLLQEIKVQLMHPMMEYESLGFMGPDNFFQYDEISGLLTIEVEGTPEFYRELMLNVTYSNSNPEPLNDNRTIIFSVSDGATIATELTVFILVENTNDATVMMFTDSRLMKYIEGSGEQFIDTGVDIYDNDVNPHIENISIELIGLDGEKELISLKTTSNQIEINDSQSNIFLSGSANLSEYASLLRSLVYAHFDAHPGNPTPGERTIRFIINDGRGITDNVFNFTISSVNDPPILLFIEGDVDDNSVILNGNISHSITYAEDGPLIKIASSIYLRDVDSNISIVSISLDNKSINDRYSFNDSLLTMYGVTLYDDDNQLTLIGEAKAIEYEKILQSLGYLNKIQNDAIINEGLKTVLIMANDTHNAESDIIEIIITLTATDDQPVFVINDIIDFTEGSTSVDIATPEILSLMDEENNDIESLSILLYATNGIIDEEDSLVYRSKKFIPDDFNRTHIIYNQNASIEDFEEFLRSVRYINQADEPTYYANATSKEILKRMIRVTFTPDSGKEQIYDIPINITLVNDEKPMILIGLYNNTCNASHPTGQSSKYSKRDVHFLFNKLHKRLYNKRRIDNVSGLAPSVLVAYSSSNSSCINNITIEFTSGTNTPPVEVKRDLAEFVSILPDDYHLSHGQWMDHNTLVMNLIGCYKTDQSTKLQVVFKGKGDADCNTTSRCTYGDGICFKNETGCPIIGFSSILTNYTPSVPTISNITPSDTSMSFHVSLMLYTGIFIIVIFTILIFFCGFKHATTKNSETTFHEGTPQQATKLKMNFVPIAQTLIPEQVVKEGDILDDIVVCKDHGEQLTHVNNNDHADYDDSTKHDIIPKQEDRLVDCDNTDIRTLR